MPSGTPSSRADAGRRPRRWRGSRRRCADSRLQRLVAAGVGALPHLGGVPVGGEVVVPAVHAGQQLGEAACRRGADRVVALVDAHRLQRGAVLGLEVHLAGPLDHVVREVGVVDEVLGAGHAPPSTPAADHDVLDARRARVHRLRLDQDPDAADVRGELPGLGVDRGRVAGVAAAPVRAVHGEVLVERAAQVRPRSAAGCAAPRAGSSRRPATPPGWRRAAPGTPRTPREASSRCCTPTLPPGARYPAGRCAGRAAPPAGRRRGARTAAAVGWAAVFSTAAKSCSNSASAGPPAVQSRRPASAPARPGPAARQWCSPGRFSRLPCRRSRCRTTTERRTATRSARSATRPPKPTSVNWPSGKASRCSVRKARR